MAEAMGYRDKIAESVLDFIKDDSVVSLSRTLADKVLTT